MLAIAVHTLGKSSKADVRKMLKEMGYSEKTVEEILKWYENSGLQSEGGIERNLYPNNLNRQKHSR